MAKRWQRLMWEAGMIAMMYCGCAAIMSEQENTPSIPHYDPTSTPTPTEAEVIRIEIVDDVPVATMVVDTPTPTPTEVVAITATTTPMPPTPTERPQERISTPTPTNTPKPTQKASIVPYPTGYPHTRKVDDPNAHTWKPYARYWKITKKNSAEYRLQQIAHAASNGLRVVTDPNGVERYCIALEPMWAGGQDVDIGRCIDIKMANGAVLHCVLADCKRTENSYNQEGWYGSRGELIEFIADETKLPDGIHGDISNVSKEFAGGIISVTVLDMYIDGFGG